jgi:transcriptional regulator with XRE-family HTH domain
MIPGAHIRAARALIQWTQAELAEAAGVSQPTVHGLEAGSRLTYTSSARLIKLAFEDAGVIFLDDGVRLPPPRPDPDM